MSTLYVDRATTAKPKDGLKFTNGKKQNRNAYPSAGGTRPLSRDQKKALAMLAARAFVAVHSRKPRDTAEADAWRRAEQLRTVGKESLTTCVQGDYLPLKARFADLAGETGEALDAHLQDATADRRIALHKLKEECAKRELTLAWPAAIARNKFKTPIEDLTAKQLWQLVFDVRSSKHKPKAKAPGAAGPLPPRLTIVKKNTKPEADVPADNIPF